MSLVVHAIDPGPVRSAYARLHEQDVWASIHDNEELLLLLGREAYTVWKDDVQQPAILGIEQITGSYGHSVGADVMTTVFWAGRFAQAWEATGHRWRLIPRKEAVTHLTGRASGNDAAVRQALIDRWGGDTRALRGLKCAECKGKCWIGRGKERAPCVRCKAVGYEIPPGPLNGVTRDEWAALSIAVTLRDKLQRERGATDG